MPELVAAFAFVLFPSQAQEPCPAEQGSKFCEHYVEFAAEQRTRKQIVAAAREAGMDDPSGMITVKRDTAGNLTIEKHGVELPGEIEAKLNGYITPLVVEHCSDPDCSVRVNLDMEPPVPYPHPDSTDDRPPKLTNPDEVERDMVRHMTGEMKRAIGRDEKTTILWIYVCAGGVVRDARVQVSSGKKILDEYAKWVASRMEFRPARLWGAPIGVWIGQPISFESR